MPDLRCILWSMYRFRRWLAPMASALSLLLTCCGTSAPSPTGPKPATSLPHVSSTLQVTGAIHGSISDVRLIGCGRRSSGNYTVFYSAVYFKVDSSWYDLELSGINRLPVPFNTSDIGYSGPGPYNADVSLREMDLYPGGMVSSGPAWGSPNTRSPTLTINAGEKSVSIGSTSANITQRPLTFSDRLELWPVKPGTVGPAPDASPGPDSIVVLSGSWSCS